MVVAMTSTDARFADLYESYFKHVHAYCRRRVNPDRVDDAAAETFLVAWRKIEDVPVGQEALPWLYAVAYGVVSNFWRGASRQKRLNKKLHTIGVEPSAPADEFVVVRQEARQILAALAKLKKADQEVLRLSIWEELSNAEVAIVLDVAVDAARQRLSRARRNLADQYNRLDFDISDSSVAQKGGVL
jgi:RNA polymerase sigma factor (sigma-70 family)